jgi:hypothetical protein
MRIAMPIQMETFDSNGEWFMMKGPFNPTRIVE